MSFTASRAEKLQKLVPPGPQLSVDLACINGPVDTHAVARLDHKTSVERVVMANGIFLFDPFGRPVVTHAGRHDLDPARWRPGFEVAVDYLLTSWDRDGTRSGYDLDLVLAGLGEIYPTTITKDELEDMVDYSVYENRTGLAEDMKFLASMPELCDITFLVGKKGIEFRPGGRPCQTSPPPNPDR